MSLLNTLLLRSHSNCELCSESQHVSLYEIPPIVRADEKTALILCTDCKNQVEDPSIMDPNHWRCLNESMWSEFEAVKVMAYRALSLLKGEAWAQDLLEQLYLEDSQLAFAKSALPAEEEVASSTPTLDSNGTPLQEGDSVTLIKDLEVKGGGFTAKRGTLVKNISLTNNPKHIEGRVNGIQIVLISNFLKKV